MPVTTLRNFFKTEESEWYNSIVKHYSTMEITDEVIKKAMEARRGKGMTWNEVAKYLSEEYGEPIGSWTLRKGVAGKYGEQALGRIKEDKES
jgi:hypothetical protein